MPMMRRRDFLKSATFAATLAGAARRGIAADAPAILSTRSPNGKLGVAVIGCGGRGASHVGPAAGERLVAVCDVDRNPVDKVLAEHTGVKAFRDYRKMFDEMRRDIDAVFVATPDHSHAAASMLALRAGKACYTEKPLTWSVAEARALAEMAARKKVATQMGNQGHANPGNRIVVEWIRDGVIGEVREVHTWTNRPVWPQGIAERPPAQPVPANLDWDNWIGPAPFREYHEGLHGFKWRGWFDFGCGAIGDMGCHTWDNVYWAMAPDYPSSLELLEINGSGGKETFAKQTKFKWVFPAKGKRPAFEAYWYSGGLKPETPEEVKTMKPAKEGEAPKLPDTGNLYIGTKGKLLVSGDYGESSRLLPEDSHRAWMEERKGKTSPNKIEPSPGHYQEFFMAARGEKPWNFPKSNFAEYAGPLTEVMLLGAILEKIGQVGYKIECDPTRRKVLTKEAQAMVSRVYRKGWTL